jgi:hypothetical protein
MKSHSATFFEFNPSSANLLTGSSSSISQAMLR